MDRFSFSGGWRHSVIIVDIKDLGRTTARPSSFRNLRQSLILNVSVLCTPCHSYASRFRTDDSETVASSQDKTIFIIRVRGRAAACYQSDRHRRISLHSQTHTCNVSVQRSNDRPSSLNSQLWCCWCCGISVMTSFIPRDNAKSHRGGGKNLK